MDKLKQIFSPGQAKDDETMYAADGSTSERAPISGISGEGSHFPKQSSFPTTLRSSEATNYGAGDKSTGYQTTGIPAADESLIAAQTAMGESDATHGRTEPATHDTTQETFHDTTQHATYDTTQATADDTTIDNTRGTTMSDSTAMPTSSTAIPSSTTTQHTSQAPGQISPDLVHSTVPGEVPSGEKQSSEFFRHDIQSAPLRDQTGVPEPVVSSTHTGDGMIPDTGKYDDSLRDRTGVPEPVVSSTHTGGGMIPDTGKYDESRDLTHPSTMEDPSKTIPYDTLEARAMGTDPTALHTSSTSAPHTSGPTAADTSYSTAPHTSDSTAPQSSDRAVSSDAAALGAAGVAGAGTAAAGTAIASSIDTGPASKTVGPHQTNIANILDPRVQPEPAVQAQNLRSTSGTTAEDSTAGTTTAGTTTAGTTTAGTTTAGDTTSGTATSGTRAVEAAPATSASGSAASPYSVKELDPRVDSISAGGDGTTDTTTDTTPKKSGGILGMFKSDKSSTEPTSTSAAPAEEETHYGRDAAIAGGAGAAAAGAGYAATKSSDQPTSVPTTNSESKTTVPATSSQESTESPAQPEERKGSKILGMFKSKSKDDETGPTSTSTAPEQEETHYGRDAAIVGGAGATTAGVGYAATKSSQQPSSIPATTSENETSVPTTASNVTTESPSAPEESKRSKIMGLFKSKSKDTETAPTSTTTAPTSSTAPTEQEETHYGRDAAIVGGAGAAAAGVGYAATRSSDEPSSVPSTTRDTDTSAVPSTTTAQSTSAPTTTTTDAKSSVPTTTSTNQTASVPTTSTTQPQIKKSGDVLGVVTPENSKETEAPSASAKETHYGRDAAIAGGAGAAAAGVGYAATRPSEEPSSAAATSATQAEEKKSGGLLSVFKSDKSSTDTEPKTTSKSTTEDVPKESTRSKVMGLFKSDKTKDTETESPAATTAPVEESKDSNYGRDAGVAAGALGAGGAAAGGAYEYNKWKSQQSTSVGDAATDKPTSGTPIADTFTSSRAAPEATTHDSAVPTTTSATSTTAGAASLPASTETTTTYSSVPQTTTTRTTTDTPSVPTTTESNVPATADQQYTGTQPTQDTHYGRDAALVGGTGVAGAAAGTAAGTHTEDRTAAFSEQQPMAASHQYHGEGIDARDAAPIGTATTTDHAVPSSETSDHHYGRDAAIAGGGLAAAGGAAAVASSSSKSGAYDDRDRDLAAMLPGHQSFGDKVRGHRGEPVATTTAATAGTSQTSERPYRSDAATASEDLARARGITPIVSAYDDRDRELAAMLPGHQNFGDKERERRAGSGGFLGMFKSKDKDEEASPTGPSKLQKEPPAGYSTSQDTATTGPNKLQKEPPAGYTSSKETTTTALPDRSIDNSAQSNTGYYAAGAGAAGLGAGTAAYAAEHHTSYDNVGQAPGQPLTSLDNTTSTSRGYAAPTAGAGAGTAAYGTEHHTSYDNVGQAPGQPLTSGDNTTSTSRGYAAPAAGAGVGTGTATHASPSGDPDIVTERFTGLPMNIGKYGVTGAGGTDGGPMEGAPGMQSAAEAAAARNTVIEPRTGLPMDVRKYGSVGAGGTDGEPAIEGAGRESGHVTDWEAIRKSNTPY